MRQLATLPNADAAQTLADYLQTLQIDTQLERLPEGCAVWVCDEDRMAQARKELADFTSNPADPRFAAARQAAATLRRRREKEAEVEDAARPARPQPGTPSRPAPWTYGLIAACVIVFVAHTGYLIIENGGFGAPAAMDILLYWSQPKGLNVWVSPAQQALSISSIDLVGGDRYIPHGLSDIEHGQVWRLVTPIFLHFGLVHLLFNMVWLRQLGGAIEERRGSWRYLLLILVLAVSSNVAQYFLGGISWQSGRLVNHPNPLSGGMSGVIYGLFGYVWMKMRYEPSLGLSFTPTTVFWMIAWLFLCMTGAIGSIANTAHVTGLLMGIIIGVAPHLGGLLRGKPSS
jgi:GlpG protein